MQAYTQTNSFSTPIRDAHEGSPDSLDALWEIHAVERDARALGAPELVEWARQVKTVELSILRGEHVASEELEVLSTFIHRHAEGPRIDSEAVRG